MINLEKGGRINLTKDAGLKKVRLGLGWKPNPTDTGADFDLDVSLFVLNKDEKVIGDKYFVFYGNPKSPEGAIVHSGDEKKGKAGGDAESVTCELPLIPEEGVEVSIVVTIYEADKRRQNFGQVRDSYISLYDATKPEDPQTNPPKAQFRLEDEFSAETAVQFGSLLRRGGDWVFNAVGAGYKRGLADFVTRYGLEVAPPSGGS